jgi:hypothetical protein
MALFDTDHVPISPAESFWRVAVFGLIAGYAWMAWWLGVVDMWVSSLLMFGYFPIIGLELLVFQPGVAKWLERRQPVKAAEWRTTRGARIVTLSALLLQLAYGYAFVVQTGHAWTVGDTPRFAGGVGVITAMGVLFVFVFRRLRPVRELAIDADGVFSRDWRGAIPWSAIDFVATPNDTDSTYKRLRLVLKPESLSELPKVVRRRNGRPDLNLRATGLTPAAALAALREACPDLEVRGPRSAGVVLPVRGATHIVEADL